jgi:hypothetical protein
MTRPLRRGDRVEVRTPAEILATLDDNGLLEGLPFMPEMLAYCGRRFGVAARADKICDTVSYTGSRRVPDGVLLDDLRCGGSGHDGCQAECRIFWKEAWLKPAPEGDVTQPDFPKADVDALIARVAPYTRTKSGEETRYRCQNTDIPEYSDQLSVWDPRTYINEYTNGNASLGRFLRVTARAAVVETIGKLGLHPEQHLKGSAAKGEKFEPLHLQPGERVRVKSQEEIARTLTPDGRNRGLWFDREMVPYCGGVYRVRQRVSRFIDERTGKLTVLKNDAITLDGVVCMGEHSACRWLCPREIIPYWREAWLERVDPPAAR